MPRKKTFTIEFALDKAMELFWERGYQNTSMREIAEHLGLSRSSIYATFGDKHTLFLETLRRYGAECRAPGLSDLGTAESPRAALVRVFELAIAGADAARQRDHCLLINTAMQLMYSDAEVTQVVESAFLEMEISFRTTIERAARGGEVSDGVDAVQTARSLLSLYLGLCVLIRSGARQEILRAAVHQVETMLPAPE
jgi:TetR/AcrR family transcriptional repressor of nem operon